MKVSPVIVFARPREWSGDSVTVYNQRLPTIDPVAHPFKNILVRSSANQRRITTVSCKLPSLSGGRVTSGW
jgi:hypothetical protein